MAKKKKKAIIELPDHRQISLPIISGLEAKIAVDIVQGA